MRSRLAAIWIIVIGLASIGRCPATSIEANVRLPGIEARSTLVFTYDLTSPFPTTARWGRYSVVIDRHNTEKRLRIVDGGGITRKELHAVFFKSVKIVQFGTNQHTALWVEAAPLSNIYQHKRTYLFEAEPQLRNSLVVEGYVDHVRILRSGQVLLASNSFAVMEWVGDLCHACAPNVTLLIGRHHGRFVLENRRYPELARAEALAERAQLPTAPTPDFDAGSAIGYYANLATIGHGHQALVDLRQRLTARQWDRFNDDLADIDRRLRGMRKLFWVDDSRLYSVYD